MAHFENARGFAGALPGNPFGLKGAWHQIKKRLSGLVKQMQYGQMLGILHRMTDQELAQAGMTRDEIRQQAAILVGLGPKRD